MSPNDSCLNQDMILRYLKKVLTPDEEALAEKHLSDCELCEAALEGVRIYLTDHSEERLDDTLLELRGRISERKEEELEEIPGKERWFTSRSMWVTLGVAASILILVGIGSVINYMVRQRNLQIAQAEMQQKEELSIDHTAIQYLPFPEDKIFNKVEESPAFPGGDEALINFLADNISCPSSPDGSTQQSSLFVHFVVEEDGSVSNVKLVRGTSDGCGDEAIRGIESMPKWRPGKQAGETVRVGYILMLKFS
ncbi:energy transducer TonB [Bacteroidota bacterium]